MSFLQSWWRPTLASSLLIATAGCAAAIDSGSFVDHAVDISRYRTYDWTPAPARNAQGPLERDSGFQDRFQGEVERQLASKGFTGPTNRRPDLLLRYRAAVTPRLDVHPGTYGSCVDAIDCQTRITESESATLVLDVLDARSRKVIWRGWAREDLEAMTRNRARMNDEVRRAVIEMTAKLPARTNREEPAQ